MDITQMETFAMCVRLRSFSKAARQLNVAQSVVSRRIRNLEHELGTALILRNNRRFELTESGEIFMRKVANVLNEMQNVKSEVASYAGRPKGELRLGILGSLGDLVMPQVLETYRALYPEVQLHIRSSMSAFVADWLEQDIIDIAVVHHPENQTGVVVEPLALGQFVLVLPPEDTPLGRLYESNRAYQVRELAQMPLILTRTGQTQRTLIEREAAQYGYTPRVEIEADNVDLIISFVKKGLGISVLAYTSACAAAWRGEVRIARLTNPGIRTDISVVTRTDRTVTAAMRTMISQLKIGIRGFILENPVEEDLLRLSPNVGTIRRNPTNL